LVVNLLKWVFLPECIKEKIVTSHQLQGVLDPLGKYEGWGGFCLKVEKCAKKILIHAILKTLLVSEICAVLGWEFCGLCPKQVSVSDVHGKAKIKDSQDKFI